MNTKNTILILTLTMFFVSCKTTSLVGTWKLDKENIVKNNPDASFLELNLSETVFGLLDIKKDSTFYFLSFDEQFNWTKTADGAVVNYADEKSKSLYIKKINKNRINIRFNETKEDRQIKYSFFLDRLQVKENKSIIENVVFEQQKSDDKGWKKYYIFNDRGYQSIETNSETVVSYDFFNKDINSLEGNWEKNKGSYVIKGDKLYLFTSLGMDVCTIINENKIIDNKNNILEHIIKYE